MLGGFAFLLGFLYTELFSWIAYLIHPIDSYAYVILPSWAAWAIHGLFLGIISAMIPTDFLLKYLLGSQKYKEFTLYTKLREGTDGRIIFVSLAVIIISANCFSLPLHFNYYAKVADHQIIVNKFFEMKETVYPFDRIKELNQFAIQHNPNGQIKILYHEIVLMMVCLFLQAQCL